MANIIAVTCIGKIKETNWLKIWWTHATNFTVYIYGKCKAWVILVVQLPDFLSTCYHRMCSYYDTGKRSISGMYAHTNTHTHKHKKHEHTKHTCTHAMHVYIYMHYNYTI